MNKRILLSLSLTLSGLVSPLIAEQFSVSAQTCNYFAGAASTGESVNVDLCSVSRASERSIDFTYYLGNQKVISQANCENGSWTTFPERSVHRPQSAATQRMLEVVCGYRASEPESAMVFSPPSNVRTTPDGDVLCSIGSRRMINIYGSSGDWYYTDACGRMGVVHSSQIRF
jgi:hypothetical protein